MVFFDLHVHRNAMNSEEIKALAKRAKLFNWNGICIVEYVSSENPEIKLSREELKKIEAEVGISLFHGAEIRANNPKELKNLLKMVREKVLIVSVHGGEYEINRAACSDSRVDILSHPYLGRNDCGLDETCLKRARENEVLIGIPFYHLLHSHGRERVVLLQQIAESIRLCHELKVNVIITTGAKSSWDIRDPRALASVANVLGMDLGKAIDCVSEIPENLVEKNRKKLLGLIPAKGVEVVENEE